MKNFRFSTFHQNLPNFRKRSLTIVIVPYSISNFYVTTGLIFSIESLIFRSTLVEVDTVDE